VYLYILYKYTYAFCINIVNNGSTINLKHNLFYIYHSKLAFGFANAAKKSIAVMPCIGDFDPKGLMQLRDKVEEVARKVLPREDFRLIPYKDVREEVGDEALFNACEELGACFGRLTAHLKLKPSFSGKVTLKFTIAPSGDIVSISIVSSTTGYAEFDNAIKNMVATWKWKSIPSGNTTPTVPFNFTE